MSGKLANSSVRVAGSLALHAQLYARIAAHNRRWSGTIADECEANQPHGKHAGITLRALMCFLSAPMRREGSGKPFCLTVTSAGQCGLVRVSLSEMRVREQPSRVTTGTDGHSMREHPLSSPLSVFSAPLYPTHTDHSTPRSRGHIWELL